LAHQVLINQEHRCNPACSQVFMYSSKE